MEAQHYLGVANVARPTDLQLEEQESALRVQQKVCQLQVDCIQLPKKLLHDILFILASCSCSTALLDFCCKPNRTLCRSQGL